MCLLGFGVIWFFSLVFFFPPFVLFFPSPAPSAFGVIYNLVASANSPEAGDAGLNPLALPERKII